MCEGCCENCIHSKTCAGLHDELLYDSWQTSEGCQYFEDRQQYLKLPCPIGSTIYETPSHLHILPRYVAGYHYNTIGKQKGAHLIVGTMCGMMSRIKVDKIGKTVFLTEAEAAASLKKEHL